MIVRCEQCGKSYATRPTAFDRAKRHFCSRKCQSEAMKKRYTVYNNRTDFPVIVNGTALECAAAMGVSPKSFFGIRTKSNKGIDKKWTVIDESEEE